MEAESDLPVIVVGGGLGGLAAALALSRRGRSVLLLEQASKFGEIGAGIQLGPNAMRVLRALGVDEQAKRKAAFPDALVMFDMLSGQEVTRIPLGPPFESRFGYPYGLIHRADLHSVLLEACRQSDRVTLRTATTVEDFEDFGDRVQVRTATGEALDGSALVGADGIWSTIRQRLLGDGRPRVSGHIAYRAVLPMSEVPTASRMNAMVLWAGPRCHFVHYPLHGADLFNLVAVFHSQRYQEGWDAFGDPAELEERFRDVVPAVKTLLDKIDQWRMWVLCDRDPIREWSRGRVTLLGDAAHPMLQYLAQGAAMAFEDALCLADAIESAGGASPEAFCAYQKQRYLRTGRAQLSARLYGEIFHAVGAARDIRNAWLASWTPEQHYQGMSWIYAAAASPEERAQTPFAA